MSALVFDPFLRYPMTPFRWVCGVAGSLCFISGLSLSAFALGLWLIVHVASVDSSLLLPVYHVVWGNR